MAIKREKVLAWATMGTGLGLIIAARVAGLDMTEGQQLATYWHVYAVAVFLVLIGYKVMKANT